MACLNYQVRAELDPVVEHAVSHLTNRAADSSIDRLNFSGTIPHARAGLTSDSPSPANGVMRAVRHSIWEPTGSSLQSQKAPEATSMSDQDDWEFAGPDDAKAEIRAAVEYLLRGATGGAASRQ